jgi:hypothetical protein
MDKISTRSAYVLFGGIFGGWIACLTVIVQYLTTL